MRVGYATPATVCRSAAGLHARQSASERPPTPLVHRATGADLLLAAPLDQAHRITRHAYVEPANWRLAHEPHERAGYLMGFGILRRALTASNCFQPTAMTVSA